MEGLAAERAPWEARDAYQRPLEEVGQISFGTRRCRPLQGHREHHLPDRSAHLAGAPARPVDDPDEVELFSNPRKSADIAHALRADCERHPEVRLAWGVCRPEHHLP